MNCLDCNKKLSKSKYKRCRSCNSKFLWKTTNLREKVKAKLEKYYNKICLGCKKFYVHKNLHSKYCSRSCANRIAGKAKKPGNGGLRVGGGHSKLLLYNSKIIGNIKLNREEIEVVKILDNLNLDWSRNTKGFSYYTLDNKKRNYYPDFYIKDYNYFLEYKGWITDEMKHKMESALKLNKFKLLIIYGNTKRYRNLGLNIDTIKENNSILLEKINF